MDFDNDGEWDDDEQTGPAIHTPSIIKDIVITEYRIEWLNLSEPENNFYAKNHMVATVTFATPQVFGNKEYSSARISMEVGTEKKVVEIVGQEVRSTHIPMSTSQSYLFLDLGLDARRPLQPRCLHRCAPQIRGAHSPYGPLSYLPCPPRHYHWPSHRQDHRQEYAPFPIPPVHRGRSLEGVWRPHVRPLHSIPETMLTPRLHFLDPLASTAGRTSSARVT